VSKWVNTGDRVNEKYAVDMFTAKMNKMGIHNIVMEEEEDDYSSNDYRMLINNRYAVAVEVRTRDISSKQAMEWGNLIIDQTKLSGLKEKFCEVDEETNRPVWTKPVVFLFLCMKDRVMYSIDMDTLIKEWNMIKDAPQSMMKLDHGNGEATKKGYLIPLCIMEKWGE
jgi:hypothetical protein